MHDGEVSLAKVIAAAAWTGVIGLMLVAWLAWLFHFNTLAHMLGYTACVSSAMAATASIRCYSVNICTMLRATAMLEESRETVRSLR